MLIPWLSEGFWTEEASIPDRATHSAVHYAIFCGAFAILLNNSSATNTLHCTSFSYNCGHENENMGGIRDTGFDLSNFEKLQNT
jgi:hypothetical protein